MVPKYSKSIAVFRDVSIYLSGPLRSESICSYPWRLRIFHLVGCIPVEWGILGVNATLNVSAKKG